MEFQLSAFSAVLFASAGLAVSSAVIAWRHRDVPGSVAFVVLMALVAVWSAAYGIQLLFTSLGAQIFWDNVQYPAGLLTPVVFFVFVLHYTGRSRFVTRRRLAVAVALPLVASAAVWVPSLRPLVRSGETLELVGPFVVLLPAPGPLFLLVLAYSYALVAVGLGLLFVTTLRTPSLYRRQALLITLGAVVPIAGSVVSYVLGLTVLDLTPIALSAFGVTFSLALTRFRLLDVLPIARDRIIKQLDDGVVVTGIDDRVVDMNPAAEAVLDVDGAIGRPLTALASERAATVAATETGSTTELTVETEGGVRFFEVRASALTDADGVGNATLYVLRDVTARRTRERWFVSLTEHLSDVVTVVDADLRVTYVSPSVEPTLGYEAEGVEGESFLAFVHPDDVSEVRDALSREEADPAQVTYRARAADGSWHTLESRSKNRLSDPVVEGIVVTTRDITEKQTRKRELERQNERLDAFAGVVSHDLRNPLSVATGFAELAEDDPRAEHFERVHSAHDRMSEIIADLLTLTRSGQSVDDPESVTVEDVAKRAWAQVVTDDATLDVCETGRIEADPQRLQQLLENLFRNSIEHGSTGESATANRRDERGTTPTNVRVGPTDDGFYVEDDGPGVPPGSREDVFESGFSTADGGTGVGLAIVRAVAEGHGWSVSVTNGEDGGARFEIRTGERR
ncbi:histidine kinase N-terminal 7TM domain-containing protein [Halogeometricum limi]|uniref:histidine kinase n=1 Tax=Halogeometricum limi TaxID=555875 RepID=A0A1I6HD92_9EURY|nr:histidine kinase N-terminal 7TM domain-containing protein [Halogeometricum limi]SFR52318.1 PAS domain S-box-containing protein [Halogeometricum limi]